MAAVALFNIGVQLSAPRWVAGRHWRHSRPRSPAASRWEAGAGTSHRRAGVETALLVSAGLMFLLPLLACGCGCRRSARAMKTPKCCRPEVRLSLTGRSGPLVVENRIPRRPGSARAFHNVMQEVQLSRQRNGAYGWSIARDIADPELWTERYHCPTWLDYLRQRNRSTQSERALTSAQWIFISVRSGARSPHAGAAVRIGALEGRYAGPRRRRGAAVATAAGSST